MSILGGVLLQLGILALLYASSRYARGGTVPLPVLWFSACAAILIVGLVIKFRGLRRSIRKYTDNPDWIATLRKK